ncbi:MAG: hypothetical protein FWE62_06440 [Firmicutes bacterium]|nr:hypothetical protein [Bacillota bacterium]
MTNSGKETIPNSKLQTPNSSKLESYFGFAVKSGAVVFGADNIMRNVRRGAVLITEGLSENTAKKLKKYCAEHRISVFVVAEGPSALNRTFESRGAKAAAVTDVSLARAIVEQMTDH